MLLEKLVKSEKISKNEKKSIFFIEFYFNSLGRVACFTSFSNYYKLKNWAITVFTNYLH